MERKRYDTKEILLNGTKPLIVPPSFYESLKEAGYNMKNYVKSKLIKINK